MLGEGATVWAGVIKVVTIVTLQCHTYYKTKNTTPKARVTNKTIDKIGRPLTYTEKCYRIGKKQKS